MPLALDPDELIELVLESDQAKPADKRVTFTFCHLPARKFRQLQRLIDQAIAAADANNGDEEDAAVDEAILLGLKKVSTPPPNHTPLPPADHLVKEILTADERWELLIRWRKEMSLSAAEKKASPSPLPLDTASSAPPAATVNVEASPVSPSPSSSPPASAPCVAASNL